MRFVGSGKNRTPTQYGGEPLGAPAPAFFQQRFMMRIVDEQLNMLFNMPVKSDGEDKSERWRGSWSDLPTEDFGILCVEDQFGGRPQRDAFKRSEDSPSIALLGDNSWRLILCAETRIVALLDDREAFFFNFYGKCFDAFLRLLKDKELTERIISLHHE